MNLGPCLCGKQCPCPDHGRFVGTEHISGKGHRVDLGWSIRQDMQAASRHTPRPFTRKVEGEAA